jgi:ELWxxDGT repeat protein
VGSAPSWLTAVGERLVFSASSPERGMELWMSDGTEEGTRALAEMIPGSESSAPSHLKAAGNRLFFSAVAPGYGRQLWTLPLDGIVELFTRGEVTGDGRINLADAIATLRLLFVGAVSLACEDAADANDDGRLQPADAIGTLLRIFAGGAPFPPPYPGCGTDPTSDALRCEALSCN